MRQPRVSERGGVHLTFTPLGLDPTSDEPLYRQLRRALEHSIVAGLLDRSRPLPSSRELSLSRNTVNLAYQELIAEGFVESRPRSGLFVNLELREALAHERPEREALGRYDWSARLGAAEPDGLPQIEKPARWYDTPYPFVGGHVDVWTFPSRAWLRALREALYFPHVYHSLQDSQSADDPLLVEMVCRHILPGRGIAATSDQVLITLGSQHGLHLVAELLVSAGARVAVEEPGYPDAWHVFRRAGAEFVAVPVDGSGIVPDAGLESSELLYVTPSHQYPTNVTLSAARRKQLLAITRRTDLVVVEDDYDSEFRYQGRPSPSLKSLDDSDRVIYLGSFSKFLAPGLRLGFVVAAPELIARMREQRRMTVRHPPGHAQRALALFVQSGEYLRAVRTLRKQLKQKWELMTEAVDRCIPWWNSAPPSGGLSLWLTGPPSFDARALAVAAAERGVLVEPGDTFFLSCPRPRNHLKLGFTAVRAAAIGAGIRLLGEVLEESSGSSQLDP